MGCIPNQLLTQLYYTMSFNSGIYAIKNKKTGLFVGRNWQNEDRSLNPKPIISVPKGADIPNVCSININPL
jgi:hypothetical protein